MKKLIVLIFLSSIFLAALLLRAPDVLPFGGCEEDCRKCHSLEQKEAQAILSKMNAPDARILSIQMSPIRGLWEVAVENRSAKGILYVGFSKKYVISGSIFEVDTASNKTRETLDSMNKQAERYVDSSKISLDGSIVMGDREAPCRVFVFTDPDCPFCGKLHAELKKIISERKDIVFYLKLMPLKFHPDAYWKSQSILCSPSPLRLLEENFDKKPIPKPDCDAKLVDDNLKLGSELGITGTPTLVLPDGLVVIGAKDAAAIIDLIIKHQRRNAS